MLVEHGVHGGILEIWYKVGLCESYHAPRSASPAFFPHNTPDTECLSKSAKDPLTNFPPPPASYLYTATSEGI